MQHEVRLAAGGSYTHLCQLLQHVFAPTWKTAGLRSKMLCCRGNVLELLDDIQELKPHMFCSVPRLWNRIYDRVNATIQASNPISRKLFETAYKSKKAALDRGDLSGGKMAGFWDKLVFSKIKARIGGMEYTTHFLHCVSTGSLPGNAMFHAVANADATWPALHRLSTKLSDKTSSHSCCCGPAV